MVYIVRALRVPRVLVDRGRYLIHVWEGSGTVREKQNLDAHFVGARRGTCTAQLSHAPAGQGSSRLVSTLAGESQGTESQGTLSQGTGARRGGPAPPRSQSPQVHRVPGSRLRHFLDVA